MYEFGRNVNGGKFSSQDVAFCGECGEVWMGKVTISIIFDIKGHSL